MRIRNSKMADAVSKNNDRILWDEVRNMSKTNKELPHIIDGHSKAEEFTDIFANKNKILYNSVSYNKHDIDKLSANIDEHIENSCSLADELGNYKYIIIVQEVKDVTL